MAPDFDDVSVLHHANQVRTHGGSEAVGDHHDGPILGCGTQTLEPLGLPTSALQGWYAYANQKQAARLAKHLEDELRLVNQRLAHRVDHAYLRSDAFQADVVQAVRAAEVAESDDKLRFIARALAGCTLSFPTPQVDKAQTMRIIEQSADRLLVRMP